jgi:hypothetical protein
MSRILLQAATFMPKVPFGPIPGRATASGLKVMTRRDLFSFVIARLILASRKSLTSKDHWHKAKGEDRAAGGLQAAWNSGEPPASCQALRS